jgi:hypothetical protein
MSYDVQGTFYEACDCEIICSCWAGIDPGMEQCTGMWVWNLEAGSVINGKDAEGCKVAILSQGQSCDIANNMLVLIEANHTVPIADIQAILTPPASKTVATTPWQGVVQSVGAKIEFLSASITITPNHSVVVSAVRSTTTPPTNVTASAYFDFSKFAVLRGDAPAPADDLPRTVVGTAANTDIKAGCISMDKGTQATPTSQAIPSSGDGLNLLADVYDTGGNVTYSFDLDITRTTAMTGNFRYQD